MQQRCSYYILVRFIEFSLRYCTLMKFVLVLPGPYCYEERFLCKKLEWGGLYSLPLVTAPLFFLCTSTFKLDKSKILLSATDIVLLQKLTLYQMTNFQTGPN